MIKLTEQEMTDALLRKWFSMKRKTIKVKCIKDFVFPEEAPTDFTKGKIYVMRKAKDDNPTEAYVTNNMKQEHWIYDMNENEDSVIFFHEYFKLVNE